MFRSAFRVTQVLFDGRNRFPINIKLTQTRKRNDRKRLAIMQENASIIREGRRALMRRLTREKMESQAAGMSAATRSDSAESIAVSNTTTTTATAATDGGSTSESSAQNQQKL